MLFNSWEFWAFAALVIPLYWLLPFYWQNRLLLAASYVFYGWWNWRFVFLMAGSTLMDYLLGNAVYREDDTGRRKRLVALSVGANLALLAFFKYFGFFTGILLPVGISFYTFQSMSYVIDIHRCVSKPAQSLLDFALYVSFFPHLVSGPIMRSGNSPQGVGLLKQLERPRIYRQGDFQQGLYLILTGLFKKIVIGDNLAQLVQSVFDAPAATHITGPECIAAAWAFAIQIYADFSGYSSIARGLACWMGIDLMVNFNFPYAAVSPRDFWHRWHISLSTWLRDYVYIPLGGNRGGSFLTARNVAITMLLGGLWHGGQWTFIAWGAFHALLLICWPRTWGRTSSQLVTLLSACAMFNLVSIGWILFRAGTMQRGAVMLTRIFSDFHVTALTLTICCELAFYALPLVVYEYWTAHWVQPSPMVTSWSVRAAAYAYCAIMLVLFSLPQGHEFIYFRF